MMEGKKSSGFNLSLLRAPFDIFCQICPTIEFAPKKLIKHSLSLPCQELQLCSSKFAGDDGKKGGWGLAMMAQGNVVKLF